MKKNSEVRIQESESISGGFRPATDCSRSVSLWEKTTKSSLSETLRERFSGGFKPLDSSAFSHKIHSEFWLLTPEFCFDKNIESLEWSNEDLECGKIIKIKGFPAKKKVKLFRVTISTDRTDYVATNDLSQSSTDVTQQVCKIRWKVEEFHREIKQLTGIESCQCRKARLQRNHIACAMLVWLRLKNLAYQTGQTIYKLKQNLLSNYLIEQLKRPDIAMSLV